MRIKLAILEHDISYLNRIVSAFNNKYADKLEIVSFTEKEAALESLKKSKTDVFIAGDINKIEIEKIPKRCGFAYFVESAEIESLYGQRTICKFQKAELIYKEILGIYSDTLSNYTGLRMDNNSALLITFLSSSGGAGSSTTAAACAVSLAKKGKKVLYLSMEPMGMSQMYFEGEGQFDFSDVIFAIKSKRSNLSLKLESIVKQDASGVYFYDSCKRALDLMELNSDEMEQLISELRVATSYQYIILDYGLPLNKSTFDILKESNGIVLISDGSEVSNSKLQRVVEAVTAIEQQYETQILPRISILYNKFSNKSSKAAESDLIVLGGVPRYESATSRQIVEQISNMQVFDKFL